MRFRRLLTMAVMAWAVMGEGAYAQPQGPDTLWTRSYADSSAAFCPNAIVPSTDGGFAVVGTWGYFDYPAFDAGILSMNADGDIQWSRRFGRDNARDYAWDGLRSSDGSIFATGYGVGGDTAGTGTVAIKCSESGDSLWSTSIRINGSVPEIKVCAELHDGRLALGGNLVGLPTIMWLRPTGALETYRSYMPFHYAMQIRDIAETTDGHVILLGDVTAIDSLMNFITYASCICVDAMGDTAWTRQFACPPGVSLMSFHSGCGIANGHIMIAGWLTDTAGAHFALYEVDPLGNILTTTTYDLAGCSVVPTVPIRLIRLPDGGYLVSATATATPYEIPQYCGLLYRVRADGALLWERRLCSPHAAEDWEQRSVARTLDGGYASALYALNHYVIVRLAPDSSSATAAVPFRPSTFLLSQNYPNPFNSSTEIRFSLPRTSHTSLRVFGLLGREVEVLVDGQMIAGEHRVTFDARSLASGVYFYRLEAGGVTETKKMLLLK